jgi:FixJ family two-component response regulator
MIVAIVDDDLDVRESTLFLLELHDFEAVAFSSGAELLAGDLTRYSFRLVDYHMPNGTGIDFLVELRRRSSATPVALMTASLSGELRDRAVALGACHVFQKPIDEDELVALIRSEGRTRKIH